MNLVQGYGIAVIWAITFMVLAFIVRWVFGRLNLFSLRAASQKKDVAVGHVLRGLYIALAIISLAAIQSTRSLTWALVDTVISMALVLVFFGALEPWFRATPFAAAHHYRGGGLHALSGRDTPASVARLERLVRSAGRARR